jgi:hypothetical protein
VFVLQHEEQREKLRIVRTVLEQGGTFSGINRKVQLKPTKWSRRSTSSKPGDAADAAAGQSDSTAGAAAAAGAAGASSATVNGSDSRGSSSSTGGGSSSSGGAADKAPGKEKGEKDKGGDEPVVSELLLILKYGGVLTHAGRTQAEDLGKMFRMIMYPRWVQSGVALWLPRGSKSCRLATHDSQANPIAGSLRRCLTSNEYHTPNTRRCCISCLAAVCLLCTVCVLGRHGS